MSFLDLPNELIYQIVADLSEAGDINALLQTNSRLYRLFNSTLYQDHLKSSEPGAFEDACRDGNIHTARRFLEEGASVATCFRERWNPMMLAAQHGHEEIVKLFLERGVDPKPMVGWRNPKARYSSPLGCPFDQAVRNGHERVARLLAPYMKNVDYILPMAETTDYSTPLTLAARTGRLGLVKMLIEEFGCKVDPNRAEKRGVPRWHAQSPLAVAASHGHADIVRCLLDAGADPNACNELAMTVLGCAASSNHLETTRILLEYGADPDPRSRRLPFIIYPLSCAAILHGDCAVTRLLLQHVDIESKLQSGDKDLDSFVCIAAACGNELLVRRLLEAGCSADARLNGRKVLSLGNKVNALSIASHWGHRRIVEVLLEYGADPNGGGKRSQSWQPLSLAVSAGHKEIVERLLDAGANPDVKGAQGIPVIFDAVSLESDAIFSLLLKRANPAEYTAQQKDRLFSSAVRGGKVAMVEALLDAPFELRSQLECNSLGTMLDNAVQGGAPMVQCLMRQGVTIDPNSRGWDCALQITLNRDNAEVLQLFIDQGLELTSNVLRSATTTHGDDLEALDLLVQRGMNVDIEGDDGETALLSCIRLRRSDCAQALLDRGANPLWMSVRGDTPLSMAVSNSDADSVDVLLEAIDHQGWSSDSFGPEIIRAEAMSMSKGTRRIVRALQRFRCRQKYSVG